MPCAVEAADKAVLHLEAAVVARYDGCCHHAPHLAHGGIKAALSRYYGRIKAVLSRYYGGIKAVLRHY